MTVGAVLAIVSSLLWVATGAVIPVVMKNVPADASAAKPPSATPLSASAAPLKEQALPGQPDDTTIERTENPDGTVTVVTRKTVVNPDGSKEVTESTKIEPASV